MDLHTPSRRMATVGLALGALVAVALQFLSPAAAVAPQRAPATGLASGIFAGDSTAARCAKVTDASAAVCRCAATKIDDGRGNPLFNAMAFGGRPPRDLVPGGVSNPREAFAPDVKRLEGSVLSACLQEVAETDQTKRQWTVQCRAADNDQRTCDCFFVEMQTRLSAEGWERFRRTVANDLSVIVDGLPDNARGDAQLQAQLELARHIPPAKLKCGLKAFGE